MAESQKVYCGGVFIGEFEGSDDPFVNMQRFLSFLNERLGPNDYSVAIACMREARAFRRTAQLLWAEKFEPEMAYPFVVNLAFSIELYLKALSGTSEKTPWGHPLDDLLGKVPPEGIAAIERVIPTVKTPDCDLKDLSGLRHAMTSMKEIFREWRYAFERGKSGSAHFPSMIWTSDVLHRTCFELLTTPVEKNAASSERK
jgi:hypothetical protein